MASPVTVAADGRGRVRAQARPRPRVRVHSVGDFLGASKIHAALREVFKRGLKRC